MRIVSLLPSATEIVFLLGLGDDLKGRSFECDFPREAHTVPIVSGTALALGEDATPAEIDARVSSMVADGLPIYTLDAPVIGSIGPDVILAQDLCRVCAVPSNAVDEALDVLGCRADVVSLNPERLDDMLDGVRVVGAATGTEARAVEVVADLQARLDAVRSANGRSQRPNVLLLEWGDPPFSGGHWMPDMVEAAGGRPVLGAGGDRSVRLEWDDIGRESIDVVVFAPCGFDLDQAVEQASPLLHLPALAGVDRFYAVDANSYFSRPGPRLVDGVELLAQIMSDGDVDAGRARRLR